MDVEEQYRPGDHAAGTSTENNIAQSIGTELARNFDYEQQQGTRLLARLQHTDPHFEVCCHTVTLYTAAAAASGMVYHYP